MKRIADDRGVTLTELLVVTVLIGVIIGTAYLLFNAGARMTDAAAARASASDEAQQAIELITRDIRQGQENVSGKGAVVIAEPNRLQIYMDVDRDTRPDKITYYAASGTLYRTTTAPNNNTPPFTYPTGASTPQTVLANLVSTSTAVFCYHTLTQDSTVVCANGEKHGFQVVSTTNPESTSPKITMIGVTVSNKETSGSRSATVRTTALVRIRAVENALTN